MKAWLQLQKDLSKRWSHEAEEILKSQTLDLKRYERVSRRDSRDWKEVGFSHLQKSISQSDYFFIGDFHTLRQSQRTLLRLLRDPEIQKPRILGLEVLEPRAVGQLERLLKAKKFFEIQALLKLEMKWGSNFETYHEIFQLCSELKIQFRGLHYPHKSLKRRDQLTAKAIAADSGPYWILFGENHCSRPHLPALIQRLKPAARICILQQNDDRESLRRLAQTSRKKGILLKAADSRSHQSELFCLLHTPIWMKWQSFIERHNQDFQDDSPSQGFDPLDQIQWCLKTLYEFLDDARYPRDQALKDLLDIEVFLSDDPHFYRAIQRLSPQERQSVLRQLDSGSTAVAASSKRFFLSETTLNSCAHAAASYLYRCFSDLGNDDENFYKSSLVETFSFFLSKLLNHSRRSLTWRDWHGYQTQASTRRLAVAVLKSSTMSFHFADRGRWLKTLGSQKRQVSSHLARLLADSLFEAFLAGEYSKSRLIRSLGQPINDEKSAFEMLVEMKSVGQVYSGLEKIR